MTAYYRLGDTISEERHVRAANDGGLGRWTPVVVIDPEDREAVDALAFLIAQQADGSATNLDLGDALREFANPTLAKPEEPTGLGALVRDDEGDLWSRGGEMAASYPWARITQKVGAAKSWLDAYKHIAAVEVLFEGVTA